MPKDPQQAVIDAILNRGRAGKATKPRGERDREAKPYVRSAPAGPAPAPSTIDGAWTHDLYHGSLEALYSAPPSSLSSRGGRGGAGGARTVRVQGDLLDGRAPRGQGNGQHAGDKMRGFGAEAERRLVQPATRQAKELLPAPGLSHAAQPAAARRPVPTAQRRQPDLIPGLDDDAPMAEEYSRAPAPVVAVPAFGVKGMARVDEGPTKVVIEGLLNGTTEEDVKSAFADHVTILTACMLPLASASSTTIAAELLVATRAEALAMIDKFNGVVADGTPLRLYMPAPAPAPVPALQQQQQQGGSRLSDRLTAPSEQRRAPERPESAGGLFRHAMGGTVGGRGGPAGSVGPVDLLGPASSGKMYSDTILQQDRSARIITVAEQDAQGRRGAGGGTPGERGGRAGRAGAGRGGGAGGSGAGARDLLSRMGVKA